MNQKHIPTPYEFHEHNLLKRCYAIGSKDMNYSLSIATIHNYPDQIKANAEFIVRACNAHDDLVAALEIANNCMREECRDSKYLDAKAIVYAALKKAKSVQ